MSFFCFCFSNGKFNSLTIFFFFDLSPDRGGLEPDFLMSLGNIPVGWSPRHLKFLDDGLIFFFIFFSDLCFFYFLNFFFVKITFDFCLLDSWLHDLESSSEVTKFMVTSRSIFSSNDCTVIRGVNLEFSVGDAFGAAYAGLFLFSFSK